MNEVIKILQINADNFKKGGMSQVIWRLMENLKGKVKFSFLSFREDISDDVIKELAFFDAKTLYAENKGNNKFAKYMIGYFEAVKAMKSEVYDAVHINADHMIGAWKYIRAAKKCGVPIIIQAHTTRFNSQKDLTIIFKKFLCRLIYYFNKDNIDVKLAVSKLAACFMYGKNIDNVIILPNGLDPIRYCYDENKRAKIRKQFDIEDKIIIGHIGRFCYAKNHEFLLKVFKIALMKNERLELWLIGNGPLETMVKQSVDSLDLNGKVRFIGTTTDIQDFLSAFDVFLFPSRYEGFPLAYVEAQVCDLPVLLSSIITQEADFSKKVRRKDLSEPLEEWADELLIMCGNLEERTNCVDKVKEAGLDIKDISEKYFRIVKGQVKN